MEVFSCVIIGMMFLYMHVLHSTHCEPTFLDFMWLSFIYNKLSRSQPPPPLPLKGFHKVPGTYMYLVGIVFSIFPTLILRRREGCEIFYFIVIIVG